MLILDPIKSVTDIVVEDIVEHPKGWLKFLFVDSPIGWIISGIILAQITLVALAIVGFRSLL